MIQSLDLYHILISKLNLETSRIPISSQIETWLNEAVHLLWLRMYPKLDRDEEGRKFFSYYIRSYETNIFASPIVPLGDNSVYINIPVGCIKVLQESCILTKQSPNKEIHDIHAPEAPGYEDGFLPPEPNEDPNYKNVIVIDNEQPSEVEQVVAKVKPITYDEYNINKNNPFKKPYLWNDDGLAWRIDNGSRHEIIFPKDTFILKYKCIYLNEIEKIDLLNNSVINIPAEYSGIIINLALEFAFGRRNVEEQSEEQPKEKQVQQEEQVKNEKQTEE